MKVRSDQALDQLSVNTIRTLAIDAVEQANSGHPGMPMGAAPMAYSLWTSHMKHHPQNPNWINRDRFVLSAGHGSMLLYSLLHLCGYNLSLNDIKNFRQWDSRTPGHPEYRHTPGVDATTGPLGQGVGMAVGMALAEAHLGAKFNRDQFPVMDHFTYAICGDGDLMEGVTNEAVSLAGHLKLGKLVVLYDSNDISLDGELSMSFSENVQQRFTAYGWQVIRVEDGNDLAAIDQAIAEAKADTTKPTLIEVKTIIGYGSPNKGGIGGKGGTHGAPLGAEETQLTKGYYKWVGEEPFHVPSEVRERFAEIQENGAAAEQAWQQMLVGYVAKYPELASEFEAAAKGEQPEGWDREIPAYQVGDKAIATRSASGAALNAIAKNLPSMIGGSADLAGSDMTRLTEEGDLLAGQYAGRNIWYGVREFGMGTAMNGMMLHGGLRPFAGTFFVFSDYLRPAIRLASLMQIPVAYVFTHDSIGVGEDGPTHEPIEQLASLRAMPGLTVLRPADANETSEAWRFVFGQQESPCAVVLTRQNLPILPGTAELAQEGIQRGAYVLADGEGTPQVQLLATGSEVQLAMRARDALADQGIQARVISMPSWDRFESQPKSYRDQVILPNVKARLGIEMACSFGWHRYVGDEGDVLAIDRFGASAPGEKIMEEFGFTVEHVVERVKRLLG